MARPRKVTEKGGVVFAKETPEDILVAELEARQAKDEAKARKKQAPKPAEKPLTEADMRTFDSSGDLLEIWQRRLVNPNIIEERAIRLKIPGMHLRWMNLSQEGRFQRATYGQGWVPVKRQELAEEREIFGATFTSDNFVCRGEKQSVMLMRIPEAVWKQIQSRKFEDIQKSRKQMKDSMVSAGARHINDKFGKGGDEAAERALGKPGRSGAFRGDIAFGTDPGDGATEYGSANDILDPVHSATE